VIAKIARKGMGFRGAANYLLRAGEPLERRDARIIGGNMAGKTPRELAAEFGGFRKLRPNLSRPVFHVSLSNPPTDRALSDAEWNEIAVRVLDGLGYGQAPFVAIRHEDTAHQHIHILASRIDATGKTVDDTHDYRRAKTILSGIERDYGLTPISSENTATPQQQKQRRTKMKPEQKKAIGERLDASADAAETQMQQEQGIELMSGGSAEILNDRKRRDMRREVLRKDYEEWIRRILGDAVDRIQLVERTNEMLVYLKPTGRLHDYGDRVVAKGMGTTEAARKIVSIGIAKGWTTMHFWGPPSFVASAFAEAIANGISVHPINPAQAKILEEILSESGGGSGISLSPGAAVEALPAPDPSPDSSTTPTLPVFDAPSPFGEEIAKKLEARRREEEKQREQANHKRTGGMAP
jgi:hypothetical protein